MSTQEITIQGILCNVPAPYEPGQTINEAEANALNQTFAENIRNNMAKTVADLKEKGLMTEITAAVAKYADDYEFGARRGGPKLDPVRREALELAKARIRAALRQKGRKLADIEASKISELAEQLLVKHPQILEQAAAVVAQRASVGDLAMDLGI